MKFNDRVVITDIEKGSEAEKSGIEIADILIRMDEIEINTKRTTINASRMIRVFELNSFGHWY